MSYHLGCNVIRKYVSISIPWKNIIVESVGSYRQQLCRMPYGSSHYQVPLIYRLFTHWKYLYLTGNRLGQLPGLTMDLCCLWHEVVVAWNKFLKKTLIICGINYLTSHVFKISCKGQVNGFENLMDCISTFICHKNIQIFCFVGIVSHKKRKSVHKVIVFMWRWSRFSSFKAYLRVHNRSIQKRYSLVELMIHLAQ